MASLDFLQRKGVIPMKRLTLVADVVRLTQYTATMGCQGK